MGWFSAPEYWLGRLVLERGAAAIYLIAFVAAAQQFRALIGEDGMLPVPQYLARQSFWRTPSLFHLRYSDRLFATVSWSGFSRRTVWPNTVAPGASRLRR